MVDRRQGMLERVPATAESAAHVFLRNLERPQRSTRLLDPRFWQHDCDRLALSSTSAAWWPHYLQKIRKIPQTTDTTDSDKHITPSGWKRSIKTTSTERTPRRSYSLGAPLQSAKPAAKDEIYDLFGLTETIEPEREDDGELIAGEALNGGGDATKDAEVTTSNLYQTRPTEATVNADGFSPFGGVKSRKPALSPKEQRQRQKELEEARKAESWKSIHPDKAVAISVDTADKVQILNRLLDACARRPLSEERLDQVWRLYIALPDQIVMAKQVFQYLAQTEIVSHMYRASMAFDLIPVEARTLEDYEKAMALKLDQDQIQAAIHLSREEASDLVETAYDIPTGRSASLVAQLVRRDLWNNLALFLRSNDKVWELDGCARIKELPEKVLGLWQRLESNDPVLRDRPTLDKLWKRLFSICLRSTFIMSTISSESLIGLLHLPRRENTEFNTLALATLSKEEIRAGKKDIALAVYRDLLSNNGSHLVKPSTLGSLLTACASSGHSPDLYSYILNQFQQHLGKPDAKAYLLVLVHCAREGSIAEVRNFFERFLRDHKAPPDVRYPSTLLHVCARAGNRSLATRYFEEIKTKYGFEQDTHCWNLLMSAYARSAPTTEAFDVFDQLREAGIKPDSHTYGILMAVCADLEDVESAEELIEQAREEDIPVTVPMIGTLVDAYLAQHKFNKAHKFVLAITKSSPPESLTRLWNSLLRSCAMLGKTNLLVNTRNEMQKYNIKPDGWTYATVLMSLTLAKRTTEALVYFQSLLAERRLIPSPLHYSIILHGLILERKWNDACSVLKQLFTRFEDFNTDTKDALFAVLSKTGVSDPDVVENDSLGLMTSVLRDLATRSRKGMSHVGDEGLEEVELSLDTPAQTYINILLHAMRRNKQTSSAEQLMTRLDDLGIFGASNTRRSRRQYVQHVTLKMDSAIDQSNWQAVETLWTELFKEYSARTTTASAWVTRPDRESKPQLPQSEKFSLSKPLNRYMEAVLRQKRHDKLVAEIRKFESAGFQMSGVNWNKYVQVMAQATVPRYRLSAFQTVEENMINRAHSWTLLRRGLLRRKDTTYTFEKATPEKPRPVLEKQNIYSATNRLQALYTDPTRKIPTYTTMVQLAALLQAEQANASNGNQSLVQDINTLASQTKHFVEQMPLLKDDVQGQILRYGIVGRPIYTSQQGVSMEFAASERISSNHRHEVSTRSAQSTDGEKRRTRQQFDTGNMGDDTIEHAPSAPIRRVLQRRPYALPYMELRKIRDEQAGRQRRETAKFIRLDGERESTKPISAAARRLDQRQLNFERRSRLLEDVLAKDRPAVAPLPKTRAGYRSRRRVQGAAAVRFVFDLDRSRKRFAARRGLIPETRQGLAKLNQSRNMVREATKHQLVLSRAPGAKRRLRNTSSQIRNSVRGKLSPKQYLIRVRRKTGRARAERVVGRRKALMAGVRRGLQGLPIENTPETREGVAWQPMV